MASESEITEADRLNEEIESLRKQVAAARRDLHIEASTIASSASMQKLLHSSATSSSRMPHPLQKKLQSKADQQAAHMQQCFYRICSPVTTFKVLDPDPQAVDGGHVLGLRFEVMSRGQFLRPYYVMLNRPYPNSKHLRVHRHTLPSAIPLAGLAARHLAAPKPASDDQSQARPQQNLDRFVRALRREIARYHNRMGVSADLRRSLGLHSKARGGEDVATNDGEDIIDVGIADIEAKQIKLTWADERSGRVVLDDDGKVVKVVVMGEQGRDWDSIMSLQAEGEHVEDFVKKLQRNVNDTGG